MTNTKRDLIAKHIGSRIEAISLKLIRLSCFKIIRARKNVKTHPIKELKKVYYFNTDYIPEGWSDEYFLKIYNFRPMIEQGNSYNNTYFNMSRMNTRGMDAAIRLRSSVYTLIHLKALTAFKLGRPDLIMKSTAFESSRYLNFRLVLPHLAEESGFKILAPDPIVSQLNPL